MFKHEDVEEGNQPSELLCGGNAHCEKGANFRLADNSLVASRFRVAESSLLYIETVHFVAQSDEMA